MASMAISSSGHQYLWKESEDHLPIALTTSGWDKEFRGATNEKQCPVIYVGSPSCCHIIRKISLSVMTRTKLMKRGMLWRRVRLIGDCCLTSTTTWPVFVQGGWSKHDLLLQGDFLTRRRQTELDNKLSTIIIKWRSLCQQAYCSSHSWRFGSELNIALNKCSESRN